MFSVRKGTIFYRKKTLEEVIRLVVTLLAHGCPVRAVATAFALKAETVRPGRRRHCEQVHRHLILGPNQI